MPAITTQPGSLVPPSSLQSPRSITQQPGTPITREFFKIRPTEQDEYFKYRKYNGEKMKTEGGKTRKHKKSRRKHRKSRKSRRYKK
jgi:hypothetical protein